MADQDYDPKFKTGTEVLQGLFENGKSPLSEQFLRWKMWARWEEIVGSTLSQSCEPVGLQRGVLIIWVPHSTVMQQMMFLKENILLAIRKAFPQMNVQDVKFTLDRKGMSTREDEKIQARNFVKKIEKKK
jgi:hypothetical protein